MSFLRTIIKKAGTVIGTRRKINFIEGTNVTLTISAPSMGGTSNTGLTTSLPATANAPGTVTTSFWGCVS